MYSWFHDVWDTIDPTKDQQAIILLILTTLITSLFFLYEKIDDSNILTMVYELSFAGLLGFMFARYYFNKDRNMRRREINAHKEKLKNDFEYRLRTSYARVSQAIDRQGHITSKFTFNRIDRFLSDTISSFKNFEPTDIDSERDLHDASRLINKHIGKTTHTFVLRMDLNSVLTRLERVGQKYHIDLTPI